MGTKAHSGVRIWVLFAIFGGTVLAAIWPTESPVVEASIPPSRSTANTPVPIRHAVPAVSEKGTDLLSVTAPPLPPIVGMDPFSPRAWIGPEQPVINNAPPPIVIPAANMPAAISPVETPLPALPFQYVGRFQDGPVDIVYLGRGDRSFEARAGDTLDGAYRVVAIEALSIELEHLPSGRRQRISLPE